jgi:hypothetical protein
LHGIFEVSEERQAAAEGSGEQAEVHHGTTGVALAVGPAAVAVIGAKLARPGSRVSVVAGRAGAIAEVVRVEVVPRLACRAVKPRGALRTALSTLRTNLCLVIVVSRHG